MEVITTTELLCRMQKEMGVTYLPALETTPSSAAMVMTIFIPVPGMIMLTAVEVLTNWTTPKPNGTTVQITTRPCTVYRSTWKPMWLSTLGAEPIPWSALRK